MSLSNCVLLENGIMHRSGVDKLGLKLTPLLFGSFGDFFQNHFFREFNVQ